MLPEKRLAIEFAIAAYEYIALQPIRNPFSFRSSLYVRLGHHFFENKECHFLSVLTESLPNALLRNVPVGTIPRFFPIFHHDGLAIRFHAEVVRNFVETSRDSMTFTIT